MNFSFVILYGNESMYFVSKALYISTNSADVKGRGWMLVSGMPRIVKQCSDKLLTDQASKILFESCP